MACFRLLHDDDDDDEDLRTYNERMNDKKTLKKGNRIGLVYQKNENQTTKPSKYMTKANKTVLIFLPMRIYASTRPLPIPVTKCHTPLSVT